LFVAKLANEEELIIITMDKDFANLFEKGLIKTGVVYVAHNRQRTKDITERLLSYLEPKTENQLLKKLSVAR